MSLPTNTGKTLDRRSERRERIEHLGKQRQEAKERLKFIDAVILRELQEAYAEGTPRLALAPALGMTEGGIRGMERRAAK